MSTTTKAAVHLGPNYNEILEVHRNSNSEELQNLFDITPKLTLDDQAEILNVTAPSLEKSTLTHDQVIRCTKAKVCVFQKRLEDGKIK